MTTRRPNILVFMSDQELGDLITPDHPCRTPHADRIVQEGIRFSRALCPSAHCCPSRATFLTGLYPSRHGVYNNVSTPTAIRKTLHEGVGCFSEGLRESGYHLAYAGKWHVSGEEDPADRGWEELEVTARKRARMHPAPEEWERRAIAPPSPPVPRERGQILRPGWGHFHLYETLPAGGPKGFEAEHDWKVVSSAIDSLKRLAGEPEPWFLFVGTHSPHDPYRVPAPFVNLYDPERVPLPASYADDLADKPRIYARLRRQVFGQLTEGEVREAIAHYWASATMTDALFGEVLAALDASGQADDTLVLRLSDHGDYAGAHGLFMKGVPAFSEAYRITAAARWPAGIRNPGRTEHRFVTLADFAPTFLDLAGGLSKDRLTGRSLVPFLRDAPPADWPDDAHTQFNGTELYYTQRIVMTDRWKYVFNGFDEDELYDVTNDPHELVNRSADPGCESVKRDLVRRMWRFALRESDHIDNPYGTVALAPWGPLDALAPDGG